MSANLLPLTTEDWVYSGGYPRLYDKGLQPEEYYPSYIETYLERDVRTLRNIGDLSSFSRFLRIVAGRVGQLLVFQELADAADISVKTTKAWLSVLETSYIITLLPPFHRNVSSRNVKSPKLYFWDTGLACSLLGMTDASQVRQHYLYGALFENMVITEILKSLSLCKRSLTQSFWRNNKKQEVDLLLGRGPMNLELAAEIKASRSPQQTHFSTLDRIGEALGLEAEQRFVIYDGAERITFSKHGILLPWRQTEELLKD